MDSSNLFSSLLQTYNWSYIKKRLLDYLVFEMEREVSGYLHVKDKGYWRHWILRLNKVTFNKSRVILF